MAKKDGGGGPGAKAKAQKAAARAEKEEVSRQKKEAQVDAQWQDGANSKAAQREAEKAQKEAAKEALKLAKKAQEEEDAAGIAQMRAPTGKARKAATAKKKKNDLSLLDAYLADDKKAKAAKEKKKMDSGGNLNQQDDLLKPNLNRERAEAAAAGHVEASGIDSALDALAVEDSGAPEKGPSRKAAYMAFEERELARLKEEYPTLKRSQLKDRVWKEWQKSPENPENQQ